MLRKKHMNAEFLHRARCTENRSYDDLLIVLFLQIRSLLFVLGCCKSTGCLAVDYYDASQFMMHWIKTELDMDSIYSYSYLFY